MRLPVRKAAALAVYLALEGRTPRSKLADLLWSELGEETARRNLRQVLSRELRPAFGGWLDSDADTVWLNPPLHTDVAEFEARLETGDLAGALALYRGPLLEGFGPLEAPEFGEWLEFRREQLAETRRAALNRQAGALEVAGDLRGALEAHLALLAEDELQESHQREAVRLHGLLGEREKAQGRFERFRKLLKAELGLDPLPETVAVAERARHAEAPLEPTARGPVAPALSLNPPLIGRKEAWAALEAGGPGLILLVGEPGVGKTRLALGFAATFGTPLLLRAQEIALQTPHYPTAEALRAALGDPRQRRRLEGLEAVWRSEAARLVPELEPSLVQSQPLAEGKARFLEALSRALVAAAGPGGAMVFDDLHWADPSSLELVLHLARKAPLGPRLIATARPDELEDNGALSKALEGLRREGRLTRVGLGGLSEAEVCTFVRTLSGADAPLFAHRLRQATGGNPLYLLETLRHLHEVGALQADEGGWSTPYDAETADYAELPIPPGVREAILDRVRRLEPAAQRLLEAASLADDGFSLEHLAPTVALDEWAATEALEVGLRAGLLAPQGSGYRFGHPLVRRTLEDSLSPERRRLVHRRMAQTLEAARAEPARIAAHLERAGRTAEAAPWRVRAAEAAERTYAHQAALEHYALALEHGLGDEQALGVRLQRLRLLRDLAQPAGQEAELAALESLAAHLAPAGQAEVIAARSDFLIDQGRIKEAAQRADQAAADPHLPPKTAARLLLVAGWALHRLGRNDEAEVRLRRVLELDLADAPQMRATAFNDLGVVASVGRRFEDAARHRDEARALYVQAGDRRGPLILLNAAARDAWLTGDTAGGIGLLEQAIRGAREIGSRTQEKSYLLNLIGLKVDYGDYAGALENLERGLELVREPREPRLEGVFRHREAQIRAARGELGKALAAFRESILLGDQVSEGDGRIGRRIHLAHLLRLLGRTEPALELLAEVQAVRAELGRMDYNLELEAELAHCRTALGQPEAAVEVLERVLQNPNARPNDQTTARAALGLAYHALGQTEKARSVAVAASQSPGPLAELLAVRLRLGDGPEEGLALLEGGKVPPLEALHLRSALARLDPARHDAFREAANNLAESLPELEADALLRHLELRRRSRA